MPDVAVPLQPTVDPTVGDTLSPAVADQRDFLKRIKVSRQQTLDRIREMSAAVGKHRINAPSVKFDQDLKEACEAGAIRFEHACFVQIIRNTSKATDDGPENTPSEPVGDVAGHATDVSPEPSAGERDEAETG